MKFLSTLSLRRATAHTPDRRAAADYFYPRSPCGERPRPAPRPALILRFLSTLSLRRATQLLHCPPDQRPISIHALLAESDGNPHPGRPPRLYFYPRSPCGERPKRIYTAAKTRTISIHALLAESDDERQLSHYGKKNFYPRSPCGERPENSICRS